MPASVDLEWFMIGVLSAYLLGSSIAYRQLKSFADVVQQVDTVVKEVQRSMRPPAPQPPSTRRRRNTRDRDRDHDDEDDNSDGDGC